MAFDLWLIYLTTVVFLCLTPGPNSLLALANGARYGVRNTLYSTGGCLLGLALLIAVAISGLGIILSASYTAFLVVKFLGVAYLVYLGISLITSKQTIIGRSDRHDQRMRVTFTMAPVCPGIAHRFNQSRKR